MKNKQAEQAIELLKKLIKTPSFSTEEDQTAQIISEWFEERGILYHREVNNLWAKNKYFDEFVFKKLSRVFSIMLLLLTKNRKFRYPFS